MEYHNDVTGNVHKRPESRLLSGFLLKKRLNSASFLKNAINYSEIKIGIVTILCLSTPSSIETFLP